MCVIPTPLFRYLGWGKWVAFFLALLVFFACLSYLVKRRRRAGLHVALHRLRSTRMKANREVKTSWREKVHAMTHMSPIPLIKIFYNYTVHVSIGTALKLQLAKILRQYVITISLSLFQ